MVSHAEYADGTDRQTDGQTPDRCITLSAMDTASVKSVTRGHCDYENAGKPTSGQGRAMDPAFQVTVLYRLQAGVKVLHCPSPRLHPVLDSSGFQRRSTHQCTWRRHDHDCGLLITATLSSRALTTRFSSRSFRIARPSTWNGLPSNIRSASTREQFKRSLNSWLFE